MWDYVVAHPDIWVLPFNFFSIYWVIVRKRLNFVLGVGVHVAFMYYAFKGDLIGTALQQLMYILLNLWGLYQWRHVPWYHNPEQK
jgi:nicotinamide riboside transporter PnuC